LSVTKLRASMARKTTPPTQPPKRGRPPLHGEAMAGRTRQALHKQQIEAALAEVAFALRLVLRHSNENMKAGFRANYGGPAGERLRRGLRACLKGDSESNAEVLAFFETLFCVSSGDKGSGD
jgi:hypothetical protein